MNTIKLRFGKAIETATHHYRKGSVVEFRDDQTEEVDALIAQGAEVEKLAAKKPAAKKK